MSKIQKAKSRLGRGLSSLISVSELPVEDEVQEAEAAPSIPPIQGLEIQEAKPAASAAGPTELPIDVIKPNPHQPRRDFNESTLSDLAASLKTNGVIQPVIVRRTDDGYQLVAGERRLRAAKLAGLTTIPAIVRELDSFTQAQLALVENIHREDLNPMDRANGYRSLIDQLGLTQAELAIRLGEDRSTIANFLRLLELAEPVKTLIRRGQLSLGHAKVLAGVADILEQERLGNLAISQDLSVRNLERAVQLHEVPAPAKQEEKRSPHLHELEKSFARQLGMRVQIRTGPKTLSKGKVVIHYASLDQFDQLLERLGISQDET